MATLFFHGTFIDPPKLLVLAAAFYGIFEEISELTPYFKILRRGSELKDERIRESIAHRMGLSAHSSKGIIHLANRTLENDLPVGVTKRFPSNSGNGSQLKSCRDFLV